MATQKHFFLTGDRVRCTDDDTVGVIESTNSPITRGHIDLRLDEPNADGNTLVTCHPDLLVPYNPDAEPRNYIITAAAIKDQLCNYSFLTTGGLGTGDVHSVKGSGIVKPDMNDAFQALNVHLAVIDDVFKHSGITLDDIDKFHGHELTWLYGVSGIKIIGGQENESVVLIGSKQVSAAGGRIDLSSPKIPLDGMSSYPWYNELREAVEKVREEVSLYREGKYDAADEEEEKPKKKGRGKQLTIGDALGDFVETLQDSGATLSFRSGKDAAAGEDSDDDETGNPFGGSGNSSFPYPATGSDTDFENARV